jgi:peptide/nickel transport system ATP-binding protein
MNGSPGLQIEKLSLALGAGTPLRECTLAVRPGEVVGLVGESGSGKSLTALACVGLLPAGARAAGSVRIGDTPVLGAPEAQLRRLRGRRIAMIFQNPLSALNPFYTVGRQLLDVVGTHFAEEPRAALQARVRRSLEHVQLDEGFIGRYPHQMSGGQLQRAMIAMAVACEPEVLIADEPTTALDVTVQARIMRLLQELTGQGMGLLLISHDLALVAEVAHRVYVMYAGRTIESGATREIMASASHPYTVSLLKAQPRLGELQRRLPVIEGQVLAATAQPQGCVFRERCRRAVDACARSEPPSVQLRAGSHVECHHPILPVRQDAEPRCHV